MLALRQMAENRELRVSADGSIGKLILLNGAIREILEEFVGGDSRLRVEEDNDKFGDHRFHVYFGSAELSFQGLFFDDGSVAVSIDGEVDSDTAYEGKYDIPSIRYWLQKILLDWYEHQLLNIGTDLH